MAQCEFYPCHNPATELESCALCMCPFYTYCQQLPEKIRDRYGLMGYWLTERIWACELCTWNHRQDVADYYNSQPGRPIGQVFTEALEKFGVK